MKYWPILLTTLLVATALFCGCTSQPAAAPASPVPSATAAPEHTEPTQAATGGQSLVATHWQLGWYDDTKGMWSKVADGSTITAKFSADGKLRGFSGCSDYITDYQFTESPKIWFKRPSVSTKVCQTPTGVMNQESAYFTDLEWSATYALKDGQLLFFNKDGRKILQFDPVP